ncbi:MAG: hypothetical protein ACI9OJ_003628 [Myxococcota bacterium]|jgi:hypothetical protein
MLRFRLTSGPLALTIALGMLVAAQPAAAYEPVVHEEVGKRVLPQGAWAFTPATFPGASTGELRLFRAWFYEQVTALEDTALVQRFVARFGDADSFDGRAFRVFLGLTGRPRARIWSIDRGRNGAALDSRGIFAASASAPLRDGRTRDRYMYDAATGQVLRDRAGRPIPEDPASLLDGYAAEQAVEMVQVHSDLALLSTTFASRGSGYLTASFLGHAFSYLLVAADPGMGSTADVFDARANRQYLWRAVVSSGGYLAELRSRERLSRELVANYRLLQGQLFGRRFEAAMSGEPTSPNVAKATETIEQDIPEITAILDSALASLTHKDQAAGVVASALVTAAKSQAIELYQNLADVSCGRLGGYGFRLSRPRASRPVNYDAFVCADDEQKQSQLETVYGLQVAGIRSAATAMRRLDRELLTLMQTDAADLRKTILTRLVGSRLAAIEAVETRRQSSTSGGVPGAELVTEPAWPIGQALFGFGLMALVVWRLNRRLPMPRYLPAEPAAEPGPDSPPDA